MKKAINLISDIRFGFYTRPEASGGVPYLQVRQFDEQGILREAANEFVKLDDKSEQQLLSDGDVLFVGKGNRLFAWCYRDAAGPYIASSIFFILKPNQKVIDPEYLAAMLNTNYTKAAFQQLGGGTNIFSIRKSELGAVEIPILPMATQKRIASLAALHQNEVLLSQQLITQKQNLYTAIISKLIK